MYPYIPHTPEDEREMLDAIGLKSSSELFSDIPEDVALNRDLNLKPSMSELEVKSYLNNLAAKNCSTSKMTCF